MTWYTIKTLDEDGYELIVRDDWTNNKREAIAVAKDLLNENEPECEGAAMAQVIDGAGDIVWDDQR